MHNREAHIQEISRCLRVLVTTGLTPPEAEGAEVAEVWFRIMAPRVRDPQLYGRLVAAYLADPEAAHPRYGHRWPTPAMLLRYLPNDAPKLDLAAEFEFLHGLALIRPFERYDPKEDRMVVVTREEQQLPRLQKRYGETMPPEVSAALRECGGLSGLRLRVKTERDKEWERRSFCKAGLEAAQLPQLPGMGDSPQLTVEVIYRPDSKVVPFRRMGEG